MNRILSLALEEREVFRDENGMLPCLLWTLANGVRVNKHNHFTRCSPRRSKILNSYLSLIPDFSSPGPVWQWHFCPGKGIRHSDSIASHPPLFSPQYFTSHSFIWIPLGITLPSQLPSCRPYCNLPPTPSMKHVLLTLLLKLESLAFNISFWAHVSFGLFLSLILIFHFLHLAWFQLPHIWLVTLFAGFTDF